MADSLRQHCSSIDMYNFQQDFPPSYTVPSRTLPRHQLHNAQGQAMAQPASQRLRPERESYSEAWPSLHMMQQGTEYHPESAAGVFAGVTAPAQHTVWDRDGAANNAVSWAQGLHMEPFMQEDPRLGSNSHLSYKDDVVNGQSIVGKNSFYGYGLGPLWTFSATGSLQRQVSVFDGSEFNTNTSSCSPKSFFSDPSDHAQALVSSDVAEGVSPSSSWGVGPLSPKNIKQSQSPYQGQSATAIFDLHQNQQIQTKGLGIVPSVEPSTNSASWPSGFLPQSTGLPYFSRGLPPTSSFQQSATDSPSSYSTHAPSDASYHSYGNETHRDAQMLDYSQASRTGETQAQRKEEDRLLIEGKAQGLTYKQIREKMRSKVAESTLRGRYRSLVKPRHDRVRKPVWEEKDIQLLAQVVTAELNRLDDGCQALNQDQRLSKVPWKKVAEYIAENGGTYHFGNSTCKKKWSEISSR